MNTGTRKPRWSGFCRWEELCRCEWCGSGGGIYSGSRDATQPLVGSLGDKAPKGCNSAKAEYFLIPASQFSLRFCTCTFCICRKVSWPDTGGSREWM